MSLDLLRQLTSTQKGRNEPQDLAFEVSEMLINARIIKGFTQEELAEKMGTKQSGIARAENGVHLASLSFLKKMADIYQARLVPPRFSFMGEDFRPLNVTTGSLSTDSDNTPKNIYVSVSTGTANFDSDYFKKPSVQFVTTY
ncbi:helix-turn-helix transcriptional regulator [Patescibacteria group bacterium]|nr:helix-turn-helix transcriptional regulator [Patescibacteria group bacterium]MBP9710230.1 helix-turn-helix transcriptional regulator [Patescibacteria group bacterium]